MTKVKFSLKKKAIAMVIVISLILTAMASGSSERRSDCFDSAFHLRVSVFEIVVERMVSLLAMVEYKRCILSFFGRREALGNEMRKKGP